MRKIIILVVLLLSFIAIIPTNVSGDYIENIEMPSEVKEGETFTVSFDASYLGSGEVYVMIGFCDINNNLIKDEDGYSIIVSKSKDYFYISNEPLRRNVKCEIEDQQEGNYTLAIVIYDAETDESYMGLSKFTPPFKLIESEDDGSDSSTCGSSIILVIPVIIGLMILIRKKL